MAETVALVATGISTTMARTTMVTEAVVALLARSPSHWFQWQDQHTVTDLQTLVAGAHDYVPWPRARCTTVSASLRGHTGPLRISQPPVRAIAAAATAVLAGHPDPRMEPLAQRKLGSAVTDQLF
jgi:hypothetical protein